MHRPVVLLTNFLPPYRIPVLRALRDRVGTLQVFLSAAMEPNREWPVEWADLNVSVQRSLSLRRTWRHPYGFTEPLFIHIPWDTLWLLLRARPRAIVSAEMGFRTIQCALYRAMARKSRLVIWATLSEHTEQGRGRLRLWLRKLLLHRADAVIVNGESGARYIRRFGIPNDKIVRVPQTTNIDTFFAPVRTAAGGPLRILYVGRLIPLKGLQAFIERLSEWGQSRPEREVEFHLVGDGPLRAGLQALPTPSNVHLRFTGFIPYNELPQLYAQADIFALPTLADEWGLVINEAMAAGLPVVGSLHSQAVEELIEDGCTGWVFSPEKPAEISAALQRALDTPRDRLKQMGAAARDRISQLTPEAIAARINQAIQKAETQRARENA